MNTNISKILFLFFCLTLLLQDLCAQVAIGHDKPQESSILDINATDKGMLIPRIALINLTSQAPIKGQITDGLMIYNTNEQLGKGFYYWNNNQWSSIQTSGSEKNIYNSDGTLTSHRIINLNGNQFRYHATTGRALVLLPPAEPQDPDAPFKLFTNNAITLEVDSFDYTIELQAHGDVRFGKYGKGAAQGSPAYNLAVDTNGIIIETPVPKVNSGLNFSSYNLPAFDRPESPDINHIRTNIIPDRLGSYTGPLSSDEGALTATIPSQTHHFVIKFSGYYTVQNPGTFNFNTINDDGARIYIDDRLILDTWETATNDPGSGAAYLTRGKHYFEFWFVEVTQAERFIYSWGANPDGKTGVINAEDFTID